MPGALPSQLARSTPRRRVLSHLRAGRQPVAVLAIALILGLLLSGSLIWRASQAAFVAQTSNGSNFLSAGAVTLTDDHAPATAMFNASGLTPGQGGTSCIKVTYAGTLVGVRSAGVKMFVAAGGLTGTGLGTYVDLTVEQGTGNAADCSDFASSATIYTPGTIAGFAGTHTTFGSGAGSWIPAATSETKTYRLTYNLQNDNLAQGKNLTVAFTWEARSA